MKKVLWITVILFLTGSILFAQDLDDLGSDINIAVNEAIDDAMESLEDLEDLKDLDKIINIQIGDSKLNDAVMGVYLSDIDFEDAYKMHYDYNYGVLLKSVLVGGAADKAGLQKGDIVMEFDGEKAFHEDILVDLIKSRGPGKTVKVKYFRYDKINYTDLTIGSRKAQKEEKGITTKGKSKKRRKSVGHGGGSWIPVWYQPDVTEINSFLKIMEFQDETFSEKGFLMHGGGGKGNVGKGWFIGGMGAGYENEETTRYDWAHYNDAGIMDTVQVSRKVKYGFSFGGVTLDKRFALSKKIIMSGGFLLGAGHNFIELSQRDDTDGLGNFDFETNPNQHMDENYYYASSLELEKDYFLFQPKVMVMYRILGWLSFRAEAGYITSYSSKGWKTKRNGISVKTENAPDMNMDGLTLSIGPWFGF
ncbi:MAG: PDZ domain-containing protein [Candidatus Cloacimonetes bacterium]|nr:PDZ domain-containing protein [Candidatus Cloacimonadota bacterium]